MVEKLTKDDILAKLLKAHKENPCFKDNIDDINWAIIGSFPSFENLFDYIKVPKCYRGVFLRVNEEIFSMLHAKPETNQKDMNVFFYKYIYILILTDPSNKVHKEIKQSLFKFFLELTNKNGQEEIKDTYKFLKLIIVYCCSIFTLIGFTILGDAFGIGLTQGQNNQSKDYDMSTDLYNDKYKFEDMIEKVEKIIKSTFPDYHAMRVLVKFCKYIITSLGNKFSPAQLKMMKTYLDFQMKKNMIIVVVLHRVKNVRGRINGIKVFLS
jgi:hypothetical protein